MSAGSGRLNLIFARRWAIPVLAQMNNGGGAKFVTLLEKLGAPRASIKGSLELLIDLKLVHPNPGFGHPMRPEYVLSDRGEMVAPPAAALKGALERIDAIECGLKKWTMPTLRAVDLGADRFSAIAERLSESTDRAVSGALTDLSRCELVGRKLMDTRPPRASYILTRRAKRIVPVLAELDVALTTY